MRPRFRTQRPATSRVTRNVTVAASDSATEMCVPTRADRAGPERAARNTLGERRKVAMAGATVSSTEVTGGSVGKRG